MTSIKPPTKPTGAPAADAPTEPDAPRAPSAAGETFREALDAAGPSTKAASPAGVAAVADDLRAGRIDARAAVERLVAGALSSPAAAALPPARRAELEAHLRDALADDPTLLALTKDLERAH